MSHIYNDLYQHLEPKRYDPSTPMDPNRLEAGLAFEQFMEDALKKRLTRESGRPEEMEYFIPGISTPILFNPDLIIYNGVTRCGEMKLTWLSCSEMPTEVSTGVPPKFDKYMTQIMSYCHMLETPYARLIAYFVNGGYEFQKYKQFPNFGAPKPQLLAWDLQFTSRELHENWMTMINWAKHRRML